MTNQRAGCEVVREMFGGYCPEHDPVDEREAELEEEEP